MSCYQRSEIKMNQFKEDIKDETNFEKKLIYLINIEFDTTLNDILLLEPDSFIDRIEKGIYFFLENLYSGNCFSDQKLISIIDKLIELKKLEYSRIAQILRITWNSFERTSKNISKKESFLTSFRKHCIKTDNIAKHNCGSQNSNYILVKDKEDKINFVICESCKRVYYSSYICCHCEYCNVDYYTNILNENENLNYLIATWEKYHCCQIINEKMGCIQCQAPLYINMKTGILTCLNKNCNFSANPNDIIWTCNTCKKDFKSNAIPYNPLETKIVKNAIRQTLLLKHRAHPNSLPCCKLNVFFVEFFHKKICRGILYEGELNDKMIIVCEKCHAINYYERFIWTCPKCLRKFKDINNLNNIEEKEIIRKNDYNNIIKKKSKFNSVEKDYSININNNKNNGNYLKEIFKNVKETPKEQIFEKYRIKKEIKIPKSSNQLKLGIDIASKINHDLEKNIEQNLSEITDSNIEHEENGCIKIMINNESGKKINNFIINNNNISIYYSKYNNENNNIKNNVLRHLKSEQLITNISCAKNKDNKKDININKNNHQVFVSVYKNRSASISIDTNDEKYKKNYFKNSDKKLNNPIEIKSKYVSSKNNNLLKKRNYSIENIYHGKNISPKKTNLNMVKVEYNPQKRRNKNRSVEIVRDSESKIIESGIKFENKNKLIHHKLEKKHLIKVNQNIVKNNRKNKFRFHANINISKDKEKSGNININLKKFINYQSNKKETKQISLNKRNQMDNIINNNDNADKRNSINGVKMIQEYQKKNINNYNYREIIVKNISFDDKVLKLKNENNKNNNNLKVAFPFIPDEIGLNNLVGLSNQLLEHLKLRINNIFEKLKLPLFNIEEYTITRKIGEGSFGVIYSIFKTSDIKKEYALKKIIAKSIAEVNSFIKEFELVYICEHPNIMKIFGFCLRILDSTTFAIYVLMEKSKYDWDKEIKSHLSQRKFYSEKELINILRQLCEALLFLKNKLNISHRDIKPQNVLVFDGNIYKLADFGEAKEIKISKKLNTLRGTELYMSPILYEGLKNDQTDVNHDSFKSDVFSLGFCFLYAAGLNFNLLYQVRDITNNNDLENIINSRLTKLYSNNFILILSLMLKIDESKRYGFTDLLEFIGKNYK